MMKTWKPWVMCTLLTMGMACRGGGIGVNGSKCIPGITNCGAGNICVPEALDATSGTCRQHPPDANCAAGQMLCGTQCCDEATQLCNTNTHACEAIPIPGECAYAANGTECDNSDSICYEGNCQPPTDVPCGVGSGTECPSGEFCYNNNCESTHVVPCTDGGVLCAVAYVCNMDIKLCEFGTIPGTCTEETDGMPCANSNGVCYQAICENPEDVPCTNGGNFCAGESYVCDIATGTCEDVAECRVGGSQCDANDDYACFGIGGSTQNGAPGTCEDVAECRVGDNTCDASNSYTCLGKGGSIQPGAAGTCRDMAECRVGGNQCNTSNSYACIGTGGSTQPGAAGTCQDVAECRVDDDSKCGPNEICVDIGGNTQSGVAGTCHPLPQPQLTNAHITNDCTHIQLSGQHGIHPPASYASSIGSIHSICPQGLAGNSLGFRCLLSATHFVPNSYSAQWMVRDSFGGMSTALPYAFQTTLEDTEALFPLEYLMPSTTLGRDTMVGRQALTSRDIGPLLGTVHPLGDCWGATLRGSIAAGEYHTCALQPDSTVHCWGIHNGSSADYGQTLVPADLGPVEAVVVAGYHSCVLQTNGTVRCWGNNAYGQKTIPEGLGPVVAIATVGWHICALQENGEVSCWGEGGDGQLRPPAGLRAVAIATGWNHTCAIEADGAARCWGKNTQGQTNAPGNLGSVMAMDAGGNHTCALRVDGAVRCWGDNAHGETSVPGNLAAAVAIATGYQHSCALQTDGVVRCWGNSSNGRTNVPGDLGPAVAIAAGSAYSCALQEDGVVRCWGENGHGQAASHTGATVQSAGRLVTQP
ncbi:MAG: hypothetical protein FWC28_06445 [Proteobacteria bacterium]|nr:hypothetical protein [Cystobacterineae bacterium]MCL2259005.1 hypothetical protein [Cystobacterineae bacterium]MCL2314870.1 hypothetical protein [Pseudomonadota bacterium]